MACVALGVLALGLAAAPREGLDEASDGLAADVPLPWDYDAGGVAQYWARRWRCVPLSDTETRLSVWRTLCCMHSTEHDTTGTLEQVQEREFLWNEGGTDTAVQGCPKAQQREGEQLTRSGCRPVAVAQRAAEVLSTAAAVGAGLLLDRATGSLERNAPARAAQVTQTETTSGHQHG